MEPTPDQMRQAISRRDQTVSNPQRMAYPGIYKRPDVIASEAAARVAPEDPILKQVFGVTRADMYEQAKDRQGMPHLGKLPGGSAKPQGTDPASNVMTKRNEQRLLDVLDEAKGHQGLVHGMEPWYYMDPLFQHMVRLHGMEKAIHEYKKMNALMGMSSSASEVTTEIPRGSLAYWLQNQGRFNEFVEHGGKRSPTRPADFGQTPGHLAHKTAHAVPMQKFLNRGEVDMGSPKVPMYIEASGVPQTGFQTTMPVGDAHWSRAVGLADTRPKKTMKGEEVVPGASATNAEMSVLGPWWQHDIAHKMGLQSVPAQALAWGAFSPQTGVTTPIGAPKLELIAQQIRLTAKRLGVSPETARDMVLTGKARMGLAEGGAVGYAKGGEVKADEPSKDEMLAHVMLRKNNMNLKDIGANEAPNMAVKAYTSPGMGKGMPVGGVDFQPENPGQQMLPGAPGQPPGQPPQAGGPPGAPGQPPAPAGGPPPGPPGAPPGMPGMPPPGGSQGPRSNILQMTQQGQALAAMRPNPAPMKPGAPMPKMADGGPVHMAGGSIKELEEYIRQHKGGYGAKRVQRAADEIPNLEDLYSLEALKRAFSGDNAQAMMTMNPAHFEQYASPIPERTKRWPGEESNKENLPTADYIRHLQSVGKFHDVPMLELNKEEAGLPLTPFIAGHEGRHRSRAMAQAGQKKGLVRMFPRSELREPFPRRSQEDYIEAMKKELAMTKGLVLPQRYSESKDEGWTETPVRRPAIKMPDIYATGGSVYSDVPKQLMGYKKEGPHTPFHDSKYKYNQYVRVHHGNDSHVDAMKGLNKAHALARANINWPAATRIEPISEQQALQDDPATVRNVKGMAAGGTVKAKGYSPLDKLMGQTYAKGGNVSRETTKPVGRAVVKEKVTIAPNMDVMQYEMMGVKHLTKKAK